MAVIAREKAICNNYNIHDSEANMYFRLRALKGSCFLEFTREFTQHDAPADDELKKSRNELGHDILSQALARI